MAKAYACQPDAEEQGHSRQLARQTDAVVEGRTPEEPMKYLFIVVGMLSVPQYKRNIFIGGKPNFIYPLHFSIPTRTYATGLPDEPLARSYTTVDLLGAPSGEPGLPGKRRDKPDAKEGDPVAVSNWPRLPVGSPGGRTVRHQDDALRPQ